MPRGLQHAEEFARIAGMEHNVAIDQTDLFGPSRRFEEKSQSSNPSNAGGINRATKGGSKASKPYGGRTVQGKDNGPSRHGSPNKGKVSHAAKHKGAGG
jgi:hypothetical protein